ncbi:MAG: SDR family NAD(P)-dependent oxidoreductase, partial [Planctomycetota bacterium]
LEALGDDPAAWRDFAFTAGAGRAHHGLRRTVVARDAAEAARRLRDGSSPARAATPPRVAFLFTGQGAQLGGHGGELYRAEPAFRASIERSAAALGDGFGASLAELLSGGDAAREALRRTRFLQPALVALELALAATWRAWGVTPEAVFGHSIGAFAAAACAGTLSPEDAVRLAAVRGRLTDELARPGAMAALRAPREEVAERLLAQDGTVSIAACNGPSDTVVSGDAAAVAALCDDAGRGGIAAIALPVEHGFHSALMDPVLAPFERAVSEVELRAPTLPWISDQSGLPAGDEVRDPAWWRDHVRRPVEYRAALASLGETGCDAVVEVGPEPLLLPLARRAAPASLRGVRGWLPSLRAGRGATEELLTSLGKLYALGLAPDWDGLQRGRARRRVDIPTYPFQERALWLPSAGAAAPGREAAPTALESPGEVTPLELDEPLRELLSEHRIAGRVVVPGSFYLAAAARALPGPVELTDVVWPEPLAIGAGEAWPELELVRRPLADGDDADGRFDFQVRSRAELASADARVHAAGRARPVGAPSEEERVDVAALDARSGAETDGARLYAELASLGVALGPRFRWIDRAWSAGGETLVRLRPPAPADDPARDGRDGEQPSAPALRPGLLDGALQSAALPFLDGLGSGPLHLPHAVARFRPPGPDAAREPAWVLARLRAEESGGEGDTPLTDLRVLDADGTVLVEIEGFAARRAPAQALRIGAETRNEPGEWLYALGWQRLAPCARRSEPRTWLVAAPDAEHHELAALLAAGGHTAVRVDAASPADATLPPQAPALGGAILLAPEEPEEDPTGEAAHALAVRLTGAAVELARALAAHPSAGEEPTLVLATRGAQAVVDGDRCAGLASSALFGLGRALIAERSGVPVLLVDLERGAGAAALRDALAAPPGEDQVAYRASRRYAARLRPLAEPAAPPAGGFELMAGATGLLEELRFKPRSARTPGPGQVLVRVEATGLNFRDVYQALRLHGDEPLPLGLECAGRIAALGEGVTGFDPGERVLTSFPAAGGFADHVLAEAAALARVPRTEHELSPAEAVTLPGFVTSWFGLFDLGRLERGQRVLIHAGTGGVGLSAIQLARRAGAQVFATAGSPRKRELLRALGIRHVFDSRSPSFAAGVLDATGGEGVDVVLNSLVGDLIERSFEVLKDGGRFIELGKRDLWSDERVAALGRGLFYRPFDVFDESQRDPARFGALLDEVLSLVRAGELTPLLHETLPLARAPQAFRHMAQARHVGKIVLTQEPGPPPPRRIAGAGTYLVTGGLGALGLKTARWLVERGARSVALLSRRELDTASADVRRAVEALAATGARVHVLAADVSDAESLGAALAELRAAAPPLAGVFHAAGALADATLATLDEEALARALAPKLRGALHLHHATRADALDHFVLYSSGVGLLGSAGQAAYAAANATLDALARRRRALGLAALSVQWGPWEGEGMAARAARAA